MPQGWAEVAARYPPVGLSWRDTRPSSAYRTGGWRGSCVVVGLRLVEVARQPSPAAWTVRTAPGWPWSGHPGAVRRASILRWAERPGRPSGVGREALV